MGVRTNHPASVPWRWSCSGKEGRPSPGRLSTSHARIERLPFDGALLPVVGAVHPDRSRPGLGPEFKHADAARYKV